MNNIEVAKDELQLDYPPAEQDTNEAMSLKDDRAIQVANLTGNLALHRVRYPGFVKNS